MAYRSALAKDGPVDSVSVERESMIGITASFKSIESEKLHGCTVETDCTKLMALHRIT